MELSGRILRPGWVNEYTTPPVPYLAHGRDRNGWDCWGLLRTVYAEQFGIELPSYAGDYADPNDGATVVPVVTTELPSWLPVSDPQPGDALLVAMLGHVAHVALHVEGQRMLHALEGYGTRIERIESGSWKRRIRGSYRHRLR